MQQVGGYRLARATAHIAGAFAATNISSSQLPVPVKSGRVRARIALSRSWVLHRLIIIRIFAALVLALILAAGFQGRGGIMQTGAALGDLLAGRFAQAGFGIKEIAITGQVIAHESDIVAALGINKTTNSFNFDLEAARKRIIALPAIADARLRKIYPSKLVVDITEVSPVARWRVNGATFVIDGKGKKIADATSAEDNLPLVIGDGAATRAKSIIAALGSYPDLTKGLAALSRIGDRRWDLIYDNGLRIRLPEKGQGAALVQLQNAQNKDRLLDRDLSVIDMRVKGLMALRLNQRKGA